MRPCRALVRKYGALALVLLPFVAVTACGSSDSNGGSGDPDAITVGYSSPSNGNTYLGPLEQAIKKTVEGAGDNYIMTDAKVDPNKQISDIQTLIARGVDVLIVYPLDPRGLGPVLQQAVDQDIEVIGFNADITKPVGTAPDAPYVGQVYDPFVSQEFADQQVKWVDDNVQGKVLYVSLGLPVPSLEKHFDLVVEGLENLSDIEYVGRVDAKTDDQDAAVAPISAALTKDPDLAAIVCYSDACALGANAALKSAGKEGTVKVISSQMQDPGVQAVTDGAIDVTYDFQNVLIGQTLGEMAVNAGEGTDPSSYETTTFPGILEYTKANIDSFVGWQDKLAEL